MIKFANNIKGFYLFSIFAVTLLIISIFLRWQFLETKQKIVKTNFNGQLSYIKNLTYNVNKDILHLIGKKDMYQVFKKDKKLRDVTDAHLGIIVTKRYKYAYIVKKTIDNKFIFLADGSPLMNDKAEFGETYEPLRPKDFLKAYGLKKPYFFRHKDKTGLWLTFLRPILQNNKTQALLVVDFSLEDLNIIKKSLSDFDSIYENALIFFIIVFVLIILFSYFDFKREQKMKKLNDDLLDLNKSLEYKISREVAKSREKDKQMLHQSKLAQMGEMISMIAHQWRQPLAAISANSNDLMLKNMLGKYDKGYFDKKLKSTADLSQHLSKTIDDFRGFYKDDKEKREITIKEIVQSSLNIVSNSINNKNIELITDFKSNTKVNTYPNELKQVVLNLLKNAEDILVEKCIKEPYIKISTYDKGSCSYMEVKDNAGGIPKDIIDKIFNPYFSTKTKKDGTGLGLYMSKTIVQEHCHGKLEVNNDEHGAVFRMELTAEREKDDG